MYWQHKLLVFCMTACLLCCDMSTDKQSFHVFTAPLLMMAVLCWLMSNFSEMFRIVLCAIVGEIIIAVCLVDCYCQIYLNSVMSPQILSTILRSNASEVGEFLSSYVTFDILLHWRISAILALMLLLLVPYNFCLDVIFVKVWPSLCHCHSIAKWILTACCILVVVYEAMPACRFVLLFSPENDTQYTEKLIFCHYQEEVPTPVHRFVYSYYVLRQSVTTLKAIKEVTYSATLDSCMYKSPHIVLVIGESYNKHHSSIYGYQYPTTPHQQQREKDGELIVFSNVVTPWNITSNVFLSMFSTWDCSMNENVNHYPLFPMLFRKAGYEVSYLSNQYVLHGLHKTSTNQAGAFFLADRELSDSLFSFRNDISFKYDMGIVCQLAQYAETSSWHAAHTLDIVHLIGQHFSYDQRYPVEYNRFDGSYPWKSDLSMEENDIVRHYDNATYYDDAVLDSIVSLFEDDEAIVVFVSDHGEEVYDGLHVRGRLFGDITPLMARNEYEVPMWIWCSQTYRNRHPDVFCQALNAKDQPFMTDDIPQLLFGIAAIFSPYYRPEHDLLSPSYQCKSRKIGGTTEYDRIVAE